MERAHYRYFTSTEDEAKLHLELCVEQRDAQYPTIRKSWRAHWANIIPMFNFLPEIQRLMYTTNAIDSLNMTLRKVTKNHRVFPNDEAMLKMLYLAIANSLQEVDHANSSVEACVEPLCY